MKTIYVFLTISQCQVPKNPLSAAYQEGRRHECVITGDAHSDCVLGGVSQDSSGKSLAFPLESLNILGEML